MREGEGNGHREDYLMAVSIGLLLRTNQCRGLAETTMAANYMHTFPLTRCESHWH